MSGNISIIARLRAVCTLTAAVTFLSACPTSKSHESDAGPRANPDAGADASAYQGDGGESGNTQTPARCLRIAQKVASERIDKLDLLFVIDNSESMANEQAALHAQFPKLIGSLAAGMRRDGDSEPFPPIKDLHVAVVSTDMGIPGVEYATCHADGGDDGKLQHAPHGANCAEQYPEFLSFNGDARIGPAADPQKFASDLGCIALLGTGGCQIEQPLEAAFKALWPKVYFDARGNQLNNPYRFIATTEPGTFGRGDEPGNRGFLRNDPAQGDSLLAIVVVTDEEDCSVRDTSHLKPANQLPQDSPYRSQDMNLRCFNNPDFLYDVKQRYFNGFRALRPGREDAVVFAVIAGVPADLVDAKAMENVDFGSDDPSSREAFYSNILSDARMQQRPDPATNPGTGSGNLVPSCVRQVPNEDQPALAYPPRRLVELAKLFGKNGIVQSICADFGPAADAITNLIAPRLHQQCLRRTLARKADGKISCDIVWELPPKQQPGSTTPTQCDQLPFLAPVEAELMLSDAGGGVSCKVTQLAVTNPSSGSPPAGEGWFYDDFTEARTKDCDAHQAQRIAFTSAAKPPAGVNVKLACRSPLARVAGSAQLRSNPTIGSSCTADAECLVTLADGTPDTSLFCHAELGVCVKSCTANANCPRAWTCNTAAADRAFCVHPKCGE